MTAFNAEDTIGRALASAIAQDWRPIEILVVDDASKDATVDRIVTFASEHPEIRLIRHPVNQGVAAARNTLLTEARGEFVIFFDDDDESSPHRVSAQIARIEAYEARFAPNGPVFCHAARRQMMPDGRRRIETAMGANLAPDDLAPNGRSVAERVLTGRPVKGGFGALATCSQAARRAAYAVVGGFDAAFRRSEDTELSIRVALAGGHFVGIAEPLVDQTMTISSEKSLAAECEAFLSVLDKHHALFETPRAYQFARRWTRLKHEWLAGRRARFAMGLAGLAVSAPLETGRRLAYALPMSSSREGWRRLHRHSQMKGEAP
jgi:GT2 family glycosyltransferase